LGGCVLAEGSSAGSSREKECFLVEEGSYLGCHLSKLFWDAVVVMTLESWLLQAQNVMAVLACNPSNVWITCHSLDNRFFY